MTALLRPMLARDRTQRHRSSTPLELFFDLTFVVGVSFASEGLAHEVVDGHPGHGVLAYLMVFFAIWWGWLNFTWFASAYDTDDWLYRLVTLVQMAGALVVAAGVPRAIAMDDYSVVVVGYVVMRLALVSQWLRAAHGDIARRATALSFALGIAAIQVLWVARLTLPASLGVASFVILALAELAVPVVAERRGGTSFHVRHISERYWLFTLIVLGEGVLASAKSIVAAAQQGEHVPQLATLAALGLVVIAGMWWAYFQVDAMPKPDKLARTLMWGYGHYLVFAAAGAVSAGIEVDVEVVTGEADVSPTVAGLLVSVPVAVFLLMVWLLIIRPNRRVDHRWVWPTLILSVALAGATGLPVIWVVGVVAALVGFLVAELVVADSRASRAGVS